MSPATASSSSGCSGRTGCAVGSNSVSGASTSTSSIRNVLIEAIEVVPVSGVTGRRSGSICRPFSSCRNVTGCSADRRIDGCDRDHAPRGAVDVGEHAPPAQVDRVQRTVEHEIPDILVAPRRPRHGPIEEIAVFSDPDPGLAERSRGVCRNLAGRRRADAQQEVTAVGDDLGEQVDHVETREVVFGSFGPVVPEAGTQPPPSSRALVAGSELPSRSTRSVPNVAARSARCRSAVASRNLGRWCLRGSGRRASTGW